jgi:hypothetical protein
MAIRKPYDSSDVFASPAEAREADARVTSVPRDVFRRSAAKPQVRAMVEAARLLAHLEEPELPQRLD